MDSSCTDKDDVSNDQHQNGDDAVQTMMTYKYDVENIHTPFYELIW